MRVEIHPLPGSKRAGELAMLVERLYEQGRRVVVWVADEGRRQILDDYLWTFRKLSFVPHAIWADGMDEPAEPVVLLGSVANPNRAEVLVVGDDLPPAELLALFEEVHDFIPEGDAGEARTAWWAERRG